MHLEVILLIHLSVLTVILWPYIQTETKRKLRGDHTFLVDAPKLWNNLPTSGRPTHFFFLNPLLKHILSLWLLAQFEMLVLIIFIV